MREKAKYFFKVSVVSVVSILILITAWYLLVKEPHGIYELPKAEISYRIHEDGLVDVEERITYLMIKPYRGLERFVSFPIYISVENPEVSVEGRKIERIEWIRNTPVNLNFRVYFVKSEGERIKPNEGGDQ